MGVRCIDLMVTWDLCEYGYVGMVLEFGMVMQVRCIDENIIRFPVSRFSLLLSPELCLSVR